MCCSLSLHNRFLCSQWFFAKCMMSICHGAPISSCLAGAFHFLGILGTTMFWIRLFCVARFETKIVQIRLYSDLLIN